MPGRAIASPSAPRRRTSRADRDASSADPDDDAPGSSGMVSSSSGEDDEDEDEDVEDDDNEDNDVQGAGRRSFKASASSNTQRSQQAHLTPQRRPARERRPPAWLTDDDGVLTASSRAETPTKARRPAGPWIPKSSRSATEQTEKGKAKEEASPAKSSRRRGGSDGPSRDGTSAEVEVPQTPSKRKQSVAPSSRDAGRRVEGDDEPRTSRRREQSPKRHTPNKRGPPSASTSGKDTSLERDGDDSPFGSQKNKGGRQKLTPATTPRRSKAETPSEPSSTPAARANGETPKTGPRPIKRPKLEGKSSTPRKRAQAGQTNAAGDLATMPASRAFVRPTSADYYFAAHVSSKRSQPQSKEAANRAKDFPPLSSKAVAKLSQPGSKTDPLSLAGLTELALNHYRLQFSTWSSLLFMGNDLMLYGVGAKEAILEDFAKHNAEFGEANVVVVRGRMGARPEELMQSIEDALDVPATGAVIGGLEGKARRIVDRYETEDALPPLILALHSLESPAFLAPRFRACIQVLSSSPHVHLVASTTHPNAGLLADYTSSKNKQQLWIDCTTLIPPVDDCLLTSAGTRYGGLPRAFDLRAGGGRGGLTGMSAAPTATAAATSGMSSAAEMHAGSANAPLLTATAALHVLKSVTIKARALFLKLASELKLESSMDASSSSSTSFAARSIPYSRLYQLATRNFIASSEAAVRGLLVEFTTHGLFRLTRGVDGEERISLGMAEVKEVDEVMQAATQIGNV